HEDDARVILMRRDQSTISYVGGPSPAPYTAWNVRSTLNMPTSAASTTIQGPRFIQASNGWLIACGRTNVPNQRVTLFLFGIEQNMLRQILNFDDNLTDAGYPGMVEYSGVLMIFYYDNSSGKTAIYAVEVPVPS